MVDRDVSGLRVERLRRLAVQELGRIDGDRETVRLIGEGRDDEWIAERLQMFIGRVRGIRARLERGEEVRPVTPYELGLRRFMGEISTEEMMGRLRVWPYTFGVLHEDCYEGKSWDDVVRLAMFGAISTEEYRELRLIAEHLPDYPHD